MAAVAKNPAHFLLGKTLNDDWQVVSRVQRLPDATGGHFSVGYFVANTKTGAKGYCKVLDYSHAFVPGVDTARLLQDLTTAFNFERDLLSGCRRMNRVIRLLADGTVNVPEADFPNSAQYLIFELADGDIRKTMDAAHQFDVAWTLRTLHHIATGLMQLHKADTAHQDLKPSNVLIFDKVGAKIGDVGRASVRGLTAPHDAVSFPGDCNYAPPEFLYGHISPDWNKRRFGADLYLLGSMVMFMFARTTVTAEIFHRIAPDHRPSRFGGLWSGSYADVLLYVRQAFDEALSAFSSHLSGELKGALTEVLRHLCDPDPARRGHPLNRGPNSNQSSVERFVSKFNLLARKAELRLLDLG